MIEELTWRPSAKQLRYIIAVACSIMTSPLMLNTCFLKAMACARPWGLETTYSIRFIPARLRKLILTPTVPHVFCSRNTLCLSQNPRVYNTLTCRIGASEISSPDDGRQIGKHIKDIGRCCLYLKRTAIWYMQLRDMINFQSSNPIETYCDDAPISPQFIKHLFVGSLVHQRIRSFHDFLCHVVVPYPTFP